MTKRDLLLSAINHEEGAVPSWTMAFFNIASAERLLGKDNVMTDYQPVEVYKTGRADDCNRQRCIRYSEAVDNCAIAMGKGGNFAFGHGGPGEMMDKILQYNEEHIISRYETGVKKEVRFNPHFYHNFDHPLSTLEDAEKAFVPDALDNGRYTDIESDATFYKARGYLPYANLNGIFSCIHYFYYPFDKLLMDMILDKKNLIVLIKRISYFNLMAAEQLLRRGVELIATCDDLGDGQSLLFSPALYRELFKPYHGELAALCHSYGAVLHLHSHGNITKILPDLTDAGINMINPFDPTEVGSLAEIKETYGKKITIVGGMSKVFFEQDCNVMKEYLQQTISTGRKGGGFVLMDSGGIPENVSEEKYNFYREISRELRR